jgi:[ribosomal protein S5]-alanine N-acetyltransferase
MKMIRPKNALRVGSVVYLRSPRPDDENEFIELNRKSIAFYKGLAAPIVTPEQFAHYISRCERDDFEGLLVCRMEDNAIVGTMNLSQIFGGGFKSAYLGYQVGAPFARQGYMTEGLQLTLSHAFEGLKLHRLEANIQPGNAASIALVKRAGFTKEGYSRKYLKIGGRWRDHERWAIIAEDWRAGKRQRSNAVR